MIHETWNVGDGGSLKFQLPSCYGLGVKVFWRYYHKGWIRDWLNDKGVCRTAPVTLGLLKVSNMRDEGHLFFLFLFFEMRDMNRARSHNTRQMWPQILGLWSKYLYKLWTLYKYSLFKLNLFNKLYFATSPICFPIWHQFYALVLTQIANGIKFLLKLVICRPECNFTKA